MNNSELASSISKKNGYIQEIAEEIIANITESITDELRKGGKVSLTGFGTFEVVERKEKKAINPHTGTPIYVPKNNAVKFKASKSLKDYIN